MLAVHLENLLFLLLLVVAGLFQLLGRAARKAGTQEAKPAPKPARRMPQPIPRAPVESDEERIRKFLEALGHPPGSSPLAPIAPRPTYRKPLVLPHVPPLGSPLPPLVTRPRDMPQEIQSPPSSASVAVGQPEKPRSSGAPTFEVQEARAASESIAAVTTASPGELKTQPQIAIPQRAINVMNLLRSPLELRNAIIVREILGPPRGLQLTDLMME